MSATPRSARIATALAAVAVAAFLLMAGFRLDELERMIYASSDVASAPVMAELFGDRGSGEVVLGYYPWLEPLYGLVLTEWVPSHRLFWQIEPFGVLLASIALTAWCLSRAGSRPAGLLVALAMAAPAPFVIAMLGAPNMRVWVLLHATLLAAFAVSAPALSRRGPSRRAVWAVALAVGIAPGAASDPLALVGAAGPLVATMAIGWRLGLVGSRVAVLGAGSCLAGVAAGRLLERMAENDGITYREQDFGLTGIGDAASNARLLLEDIALFGHGRLGGAGSFAGTLEVAIAIAMMILLPLLLIAIVWRGWRILRAGDGPPEARILGIYWAVAAIAITAAFIVSTAPEDVTAVRYMTVLWPALLSLTAIAWGARALTPLAAFAAGAAVLGCIDLSRGVYAPDPDSPTPTEVAGVEGFVRENRLDHGYAGYWDAAAATYRSDYDVLAYPIDVCGPGFRARCPFPFHTIESWYQPKPGARTFYIEEEGDLPNAVGPPPADWKHPFAEARFGSLHVYAYDYDLASVLGPGP